MFCTSQVSDLEYCDVFSLTIFFFFGFTSSVYVQTPINSQLTSSGASARSTMLTSSVESFRPSVSCEFISMHALKANVNHTNCATLYTLLLTVRLVFLIFVKLKGIKKEETTVRKEQ